MRSMVGLCMNASPSAGDITGAGAGGGVPGLDLGGGDISTATVLSFRGQTGYFLGSATGIVIGPNHVPPADCTILGQSAAASGTGINNTIMGSSAGNALTTGDRNVLMGHWAGRNLTTGRRNVAIGEDTLSTCTDCNGSTAVGYAALQQQNTGTGFNTAVGWGAGQATQTGGSNVFIGYECLGDADAAECVAVGRGCSVVDPGCIAIGYFADAANYSAVSHQAPLGLGTTNAGMVVAAAPIGAQVAYLRININVSGVQTNYAIPLYAEQ